MAKKKIRIGTLFSGIGAFEHALNQLGINHEIKFACVDGPDFDGHLVDFDETIKRNLMYEKLEKKAYDDVCNLLKGEK